jgi:hypothetical protein
MLVSVNKSTKIGLYPPFLRDKPEASSLSKYSNIKFHLHAFSIKSCPLGAIRDRGTLHRGLLIYRFLKHRLWSQWDTPIIKAQQPNASLIPGMQATGLRLRLWTIGQPLMLNFGLLENLH